MFGEQGEDACEASGKETEEGQDGRKPPVSSSARLYARQPPLAFLHREEVSDSLYTAKRGKRTGRLVLGVVLPSRNRSFMNAKLGNKKERTMMRSLYAETSP